MKTVKTEKTEKNTAVKKQADAAVKAEEAAVVSEAKEDMPKAEELVNEVKADEPKAEEPKAKAKSAAPKKPAAKKETASAKKETAAAKKETAVAKKETASAKTEKAAKAAKTAASAKIVLQISGNEMTMENIVDRVKEAYVTEGNSASKIKDIAVYIKPEENMIYYVVDGYASGIALR